MGSPVGTNILNAQSIWALFYLFLIFWDNQFYCTGSLWYQLEITVMGVLIFLQPHVIPGANAAF